MQRFGLAPALLQTLTALLSPLPRKAGGEGVRSQFRESHRDQRCVGQRPSLRIVPHDRNPRYRAGDAQADERDRVFQIQVALDLHVSRGDAHA